MPAARRPRRPSIARSVRGVSGSETRSPASTSIILAQRDDKRTNGLICSIMPRIRNGYWGASPSSSVWEQIKVSEEKK
jgi:hypothetical protein